MWVIVFIDYCTLHRNVIMPYFDLILFYENIRFSILNRSSSFVVNTVFTSMASF